MGLEILMSSKVTQTQSDHTVCSLSYVDLSFDSFVPAVLHKVLVTTRKLGKRYEQIALRKGL